MVKEVALFQKVKNKTRDLDMRSAESADSQVRVRIRILEFFSPLICICPPQAPWPSTCRTPATAALRARTRGARGWAAGEAAGAAPGWR